MAYVSKMMISFITMTVLFMPTLSISSESVPVITEHPSSTSVPRNSPVTLNCGVSGSPQPTVSWLKDGSPVKTGAGDHLMILPDGSLFFLRTVQNKKKQDSGEYRCQAENQNGAVLSKPATLTITFLRDSFGVVPTIIEAMEGEDVKLTCLAPEGNPKPAVRWIKDGESVGRKADSSGSLILKTSRMADSGQYSCMVSNTVGVRQGKTVSVIVKPRIPPFITQAKLIDSSTGLVHWLAQEEATGYTVLVFRNNQLIKNISIERDVTQVKLHNLVKGELYSVQVSGSYGVISSNLSLPHDLEPATKEVILHPPTEDIPMWVWVLAMTVVVVVTTVIVVAVALICHRTTKMRLAMEQRSQCDYADSEKMSWMDRSWNFNTGSRVSTFSSNKGLIHDAQYDYAVPADQAVTYDYSQGYSVADSAHYASNSILKHSYYLPLNLTKDTDSQRQSSYRLYSQPVGLS